MPTALILGATGQVGGYLLKELLASPHYTRVAEFGRRTTPLEAEAARGKLEQKVIDFEKLEEAGLGAGEWDVVFITLGTTAKAAGSSAAFERIDREYVINAAEAAKSASGHPQRLIYVSTGGANSKSMFLYPRSKGLTEEGLARLGYADTIVFRPGLLAGTDRPDFRLAEKIAAGVTGVLSHLSSSVEIKVATLAQSLVLAGRLGSAGLPPAAGAAQEGSDSARFTVVGNAGALALAKQFQLEGEGKIES
ncbi:hypothetical protein B0H11DRAFT_2169653 [Mycena galericulata]|nr:hypothetical protein B0H11DRAFT_2169653 [Mycena galericulata]